MVDTAPPLRHGGAGRFDRAMRRAVAFAKRDGTIACVELHDFASKQTVKFRFHERATNKAKVAAPTGRGDWGWRQRGAAQPPVAPAPRDEPVARRDRREGEQRERRGPNSRQRRSMRRLMEHKVRKVVEEMEHHWKVRTHVETKVLPVVEEVERKRVVSPGPAIATAASVVATAATETPRARRLTQKEWAEEQWDAESAWRDAESARRCGGDGVAAQEGKIQRVRGVAAGGAGGVHPAQA